MNAGQAPSTMMVPKPVAPAQLSWLVRGCSLLAGMVLAGLLMTARGLDPSETGRGTHQQLGLPPCTSVVLFDLPCPACGMTTSWAWFTRGCFDKAAKANLGGLMLALIGLAFIPASCYFCIRGTPTQGGWFSLLLACALLLSLLSATVQWVTALTAP